MTATNIYLYIIKPVFEEKHKKIRKALVKDKKGGTAAAAGPMRRERSQGNSTLFEDEYRFCQRVFSGKNPGSNGSRRINSEAKLKIRGVFRLDGWNQASILVTGGTGSFGKQFICTVLQRFSPKKLIVYSRVRLKQFEMQQDFNQECMRYFIGDVRDGSRLKQAMRDVDYVIHAAT